MSEGFLAGCFQGELGETMFASRWRISPADDQGDPGIFGIQFQDA
jgi:hypothetical protein